MKVNKSTLLITGLLVVIALFFVFIQKSSAPEHWQNNSNSEESTSQIVTLTGKFVCLPHKDTSGPQTMECALGMRVENGAYYALQDTTTDYSLVSQAQTDKQIRVSGTLTLEESDTYQSIGTIKMTAVERF